MASVPVPFGPLSEQSGQRDGIAAEDLLDHLMVPRTIGLLLVRLGGYRAGVVLASSTGSRLVHGCTAAGGQSQQRFGAAHPGRLPPVDRAAGTGRARVLDIPEPRRAVLDESAHHAAASKSSCARERRRQSRLRCQTDLARIVVGIEASRLSGTQGCQHQPQGVALARCCSTTGKPGRRHGRKMLRAISCRAPNRVG
jgi:Actinobacteria/chloroflexi VLRF1 release factor